MEVPGIRLIRLASRLVPHPRRQAWRLEWEAEVSYAWRRLCDRHTPSRLARLKLRVRAATSLIDALLEGKETMKMTGLINDLRFAARALARQPGFTAIAVVTLGLGIGANTAVFSLVDNILIRPLRFEQSERLLSIEHLGRDGQDELPISPGLYLLYRDQAGSLTDVAMHVGSAANFVAEGVPERVLGQSVTPSFFSTLRVEAAQGRTFLEEENAPGAEPVVILSDGLWRSNFGADPSILGQTVDMSGVMRRVVGVMPPGFGFPDQTARYWLPMTVDEAQAPLASFFAGGIARMSERTSVDGVRTEIGGLLTRLPEIFPESGGARFLDDVGLRARIVPLKEQLVDNISTTLWVLLGTVGFVLLIASANVANLLLVRAEGRQRELALRVAVGAGRFQVMRTFLGESVLLAATGGALGLAIAFGALRITSTIIPTDLPRLTEVGLDARVLAFTASVALGCALFFGLFPLLRYGANDLAGQLKDGGSRGGTGGRERHRLRDGLVMAQIALALVLLVGSGLMFRSFSALRSVDPGFDSGNTLTARIIVPRGEVSDPLETAEFFRQLQDRIASQPGVTATGLSTAVPLGGGGAPFGGMAVEDHPRAQDELPIFASLMQADVGYFEALQIPLLEGRTFRRGDGGDGERAAIVSRAFAEKWWPNQSPLGRGIRFGAQNEEWYRIVGVVENVQQQGLAEPPQDAVYFPTLTEVDGNFSVARAQDIAIRVTGDPTSFVQVLRREMQALNPRIPLANPRTMEDIFSGATARTSFTLTLLGAASGIALLLGLVGIYGVISYVVSQRTREIGVRMALGASSPTVRTMVVRQGLVLTTWGVLVGLGAALALSRVMASLLFTVSATDPMTYASVAGALVVVATLASWLPAHRAARVNPSTALRTE